MKAQFTITLAPLDAKYLDKIREWRNDYKVWRWCRQNDLISDGEQEQWFRAQEQDKKIKMYRIDVGINKNQEIVGVCGFTGIDMLNRRAEFSLYIAPEHSGHGYGEDALKILIGHGFTNYGFNTIWGEVFAGNPALNMFATVGFKPEGRRRQFYYREGKFIDAILISITREDWEKAYGSKQDDNSSDSDISVNPDDSVIHEVCVSPVESEKAS